MPGINYLQLGLMEAQALHCARFQLVEFLRHQSTFIHSPLEARKHVPPVCPPDSLG